jgi:hypothetical protein
MRFVFWSNFWAFPARGIAAEPPAQREAQAGDGANSPTQAAPKAQRSGSPKKSLKYVGKYGKQ